MSFLASPAAIWDGLKTLGLTAEAKQCAEEFETLLEAWANRLAKAADVNAGRATMDHDAFSGLLVCMFPKTPGQPLPACLEGADTDSEWDEEPTPQSIPQHGAAS